MKARPGRLFLCGFASSTARQMQKTAATTVAASHVNRFVSSWGSRAPAVRSNARGCQAIPLRASAILCSRSPTASRLTRGSHSQLWRIRCTRGRMPVSDERSARVLRENSWRSFMQMPLPAANVLSLSFGTGVDKPEAGFTIAACPMNIQRVIQKGTNQPKGYRGHAE